MRYVQSLSRGPLTLPANQRTICRLKLDGVKGTEIAKQLGKSQAYVSQAFHEAIVSAEKADVHDFDNTQFFEGCLPIEVIASRGLDTMRFGPLKPVGLIDPSTGRLQPAG